MGEGVPARLHRLGRRRCSTTGPGARAEEEEEEEAVGELVAWRA